MTGRPSGAASSSWLAWSGFGMAVLSIVYQAGILSSEQKRQGERLSALEASDKARVTTIEAINIRGAIMDDRGKRIEAKLDGILDGPHAGDKP